MFTNAHNHVWLLTSQTSLDESIIYTQIRSQILISNFVGIMLLEL